MSRADHPRGSVPALASEAAVGPAPIAPVGPDEPGDSARRSPRRGPSARLVWRAVRRHWWQAALLWLAGSAGLIALALAGLGPTFDASAAIRVDPGVRGPSREGGPVGDFEVFKETQVKRVTNPEVIASALAAHPDLLRLPRLARSRDPEVEIREALSVLVVPRTNLIQVSMSGESADEAARVVNAVVEAYLEVALDADQEWEDRRRRLREVKQERAAAVRQKREAIALLVGRIGSVDPAQARDRNAVTVETYKVLTQQLLQVDLELVEAQARRGQLRGDQGGPAPGDPAASGGATVAAFYATPQVAEVQAKLARARESLVQAERIARDPADPSRVAARKEADELQATLDALWAEMRPALARAGRGRAAREAEVRASEQRVDGLNARLAQLNDRLERLNARTRSAGSDELTLEFARHDLNRAEAVLDTVTRGLDRVEFEAGDPVARFRQEYRARASAGPNVDRRLRAMAAAPVGVLALVLGLLTLVEIRAGRVVDPEEVPGRLRLEVLGVVPPLPRARPSPGRPAARDDARSRRDLGQFIQSLDHLRVAICSGRDPGGRPRRSILITSACGSEGKTTLAAQLAERCVNAGLSTLLIDADLRNPTLSRMFDAASGRGLVDVLRGEALAEEAITTIGEAGGLHFLPSGSRRVDPSRLLHGDRLARLLARARESFDLVIVDAPPVLPVPDALTIGRLVDGAVLAVRFDASRYPLVERANRRLDAVGVPVIGAVINGVRGAEAAYYGSYDPSGGEVDGGGGTVVEA